MINHLASYGWTLWLIIAGMAAVTLINRAGLLLLSGRFVLPPALQRALKYAPAAALAAIVVPDLLVQGNQVDLTIANARLYAGLTGLVIAVLIRSSLPAILARMLVLHALDWLK